MSRLDEFVDDVLYHAKSAADVASKKTGEVVETSKLRYHIKQVSWDVEKAYAKLGAIVYEAKKSGEDFDEIIQMAVDEIDDLTERLQLLEERLCAYKKVMKCKNCGKENELSAVFCNRCGHTFAVDEEVLEDEEPTEE